MSGPLVSIVTPSLNQGWSIEDAILSVKAQTYPHVEHIIMDGGSTDQTLDVIRRYEGTYDLRWRSEADEGMYDAINKGLRMASGDVLCYLNCDDQLFPWSISTAVAYLDRCEMVYGDLVVLRQGMPGRYFGIAMPLWRRFYEVHGVIAQPTVFFTREVYRRVGEFDGRRFSLIADCDYWLRILASGFRVEKIWEFQAVQHDHGATLRSRHAQKLKEEISVLRDTYAGKVSRLELALWRKISKVCWRMLVLTFGLGLFPALWPNYRAREPRCTWRETGEIFRSHRPS